MFYIDKKLTSGGRFDRERFTNDMGDFREDLDSFFINELKNLPVWENYRVEMGKTLPTTWSYELYNGDDSLWWILLDYNLIVSITDVVVGQWISAPNISDIETLFISLRVKQNALDKMIQAQNI